MIEVLCLLIAFLLLFLLFWIGKIFYVMQKSLNEVIKGMNSLDQRLSRIEDSLGSANDSDS